MFAIYSKKKSSLFFGSEFTGVIAAHFNHTLTCIWDKMKSTKKSSHSARKSGHSNQKRKKYTQKDAKESFDCWKLFIVFSSPPLRIYISMLGCYCIRIWNRRAKNAMQNNWGRVWRLVGIDKPPRLLRNAALNFYSLFTKCE